MQFTTRVAVLPRGAARIGLTYSRGGWIDRVDSVDTPVQGVYKRILIADRRLVVRACPARGLIAGRLRPVQGKFGFDHFRKETEKL
jgi:hypothetical protein